MENAQRKRFSSCNLYNYNLSAENEKKKTETNTECRGRDLTENSLLFKQIKARERKILFITTEDSHEFCGAVPSLPFNFISRCGHISTSNVCQFSKRIHKGRIQLPSKMTSPNRGKCKMNKDKGKGRMPSLYRFKN